VRAAAIEAGIPTIAQRCRIATHKKPPTPQPAVRTLPRSWGDRLAPHVSVYLLRTITR
jgi:hypothetical protein